MVRAAGRRGRDLGRRDADRGRARGGEGIPASRSARARLAVASTALVGAAGTGAWLALAADEGILVRSNVVAGIAATVLLGAGLALRVPVAIPVAVALLGLEYVAVLGFEGDALDARAPLVGGALLAVAELGYWSLELHGAITDEAGTYLRRAALLATLLLGVVGLGVLLLALVEAVSAGGAAIDLLGAVAAVAALALVALAAHRTAR